MKLFSNRQNDCFESPFSPSELLHWEFYQFFWHLKENKKLLIRVLQKASLQILQWPLNYNYFLCDSFKCLLIAAGLVETVHFWLTRFCFLTENMVQKKRQQIVHWLQLLKNVCLGLLWHLASTVWCDLLKCPTKIDTKWK